MKANQPLILAVIGSRSFQDKNLLYAELDKIQGIKLIVSGGAKGADSLAEQYADDRKIHKKIFKADWENLNHPDARIKTRQDGAKYDANAGPRRNKTIIDTSNQVVAFWDGVSPGTKDAIRYAEKQGKTVKVVKFKTKVKGISMSM